MTGNRIERTAASGGLTVVLAFVVMVVINGSAPVAMQIAFEEMAPLWSGGTRFVLGGMLLGGAMVIQRTPMPRGNLLGKSVLFGVLSTGIAPILFLLALVELPSSLFQTLLSLIPLLTLFLATLAGQERITLWGMLGAIAAGAGTAIAVGGAGGGRISLLHVGFVLIGTVSLAQSGVIARDLQDVHPTALNAIGLTVGGVMVLIGSWALGEAWVIPQTTRVWAAFIYTTLFAVGAAYLLFLFILKFWPASTTAYGFLLSPLVTAVLGALLLGERITGVFVVGTALVLAGVYVGALWGNRRDEGEGAQEEGI